MSYDNAIVCTKMLHACLRASGETTEAGIGWDEKSRGLECGWVALWPLCDPCLIPLCKKRTSPNNV